MDNQPYVPAKFFPISLKGVQPDDFTFVFGYPGSTYEYVPSYHLMMLSQQIYPRLISVRDIKLEIMNRDMEADPKVRIQYSAKNASVSNSWKRWIGEIRGLDKLDAINKKKDFELEFQAWAESDKKRNQKYGELLSDYKYTYEDYTKYRLARDYINEVFLRNGAELVSFAGKFNQLVNKLDDGASEEEIKVLAGDLIQQTNRFFSNYNHPTDFKLFISLFRMYGENISPSSNHPFISIFIQSIMMTMKSMRMISMRKQYLLIRINYWRFWNHLERET